MPFYLYSCKSEGDDSILFEYQKDVRLAGHGLISTAAKDHGHLGKDEHGWRLSAKQICENAGINNGRMISSVTPARTEDKIFASIEFVSGYSYKSWVPLCFHMIEVAGGTQPDRENFSCKKVDTNIFRSFFYYRVNENGVWNCQPPGSYNSPLLWQPSLDFFRQEIDDIGFKFRITI